MKGSNVSHFQAWLIISPMYFRLPVSWNGKAEQRDLRNQLCHPAAPVLYTFNNYSILKPTLKESMYLPFEEHKQDMRMRANVLHSRTPSTYLSSQDVVKYLGHIFFSLLKKQTTIKLYNWNRWIIWSVSFLSKAVYTYTHIKRNSTVLCNIQKH